METITQGDLTKIKRYNEGKEVRFSESSNPYDVPDRLLHLVKLPSISQRRRLETLKDNK